MKYFLIVLSSVTMVLNKLIPQSNFCSVNNSIFFFFKWDTIEGQIQPIFSSVLRENKNHTVTVSPSQTQCAIATSLQHYTGTTMNSNSN